MNGLSTQAAGEATGAATGAAALKLYSELYKCDGCSQSASALAHPMLYIDFHNEEFTKYCSCGAIYNMLPLVYCSRRCLRTKCYWFVHFDREDPSRAEVHIEDECCGCGMNICFQAEAEVKNLEIKEIG